VTYVPASFCFFVVSSIFPLNETLVQARLRKESKKDNLGLS
jgi:hypothetical protein